jgi:putative nucleotidyltransferase with HDIG domain
MSLKNPWRGLLLKVEDLPTLPPFVLRLIQVLNDDGSTAKDMELVIRQDPALSSKILRLANSTFFGLSGKVGALDHAIVLLGTRYIQALAVSVSIVDTQAYRRAKGRLPLESYWIHSFACAWVCNRLMLWGGVPQMEEAFVSGLLHDLGKPILWIYQEELYTEVMDLIRTRDVETHVAETQVFGFNHAELGGELVRWWKLPREITSCVRDHHNGNGLEPAVVLVQLADFVAKLAGFTDGLNPNNSVGSGPPGILQYLDRNKVQELVEELRERPEEIQEVVMLLHGE